MSQIAEVIKYEGDNSTFIWKHPSEDFNSLTQLIVHESQEAIFFMNGQALDLFGPGRYTLETQNIPKIGKVLNRATGDKSPFHCEVYFINKTEQMSIKWGTDSKVQYVEPTYGFPISIGASGEMSLSVGDSRKVLIKLVGTEKYLGQQKLVSFFRAFLMTRVKTYIAQVIKANAINIFEIDENLATFSENIHKLLIPDFAEYGITLERFFVTTIVKPDDDSQYKKFKELHFRQYADIAEAKLRQQTDLIYAQTEAQKLVIDSQAMATKRAQEGYTYAQERGFDVAEKVAQNEAVGQFTNMGVGLGTMAGVGGVVGTVVGTAVNGAMNDSAAANTTPTAQPQDDMAAFKAKIEKLTMMKDAGLITEEERYKEVVETWKATDDKLTEALLTGLDKYNNIFMMADSGARGSDKQIKQLAGMRGLMADTTGRTIELPIKSNFREGLDVLEYFMSAHGARKGLSDTALRTADSGYLTRRLVDVSQELIIHDSDCAEEGKEIPGMYVSAFMDGNEEIESLQERITGRYSCEDIKDKDGNVLVKANHMITPRRAERVMKKGVDENGESLKKVKIRTILTCKCKNGVCAKCYGANMATGEAVQVGEAVGIVAAQSIGEPGTQLTMRTFHTGGVAGDDITQGLPRVEELFEARKPKGLAIITEFAGRAMISDTKKKREIIVTNDETGESKAYLIPYGSRIKIQDGVMLEAGDELTEGSVNPHDILKIKGLRAVQDYMLQEVQRVYRLQGVEINDKHIEVIVRQMLKKVRIEEKGDTEFLPGTMVDVLEFNEVNERLEEEGKEPAIGEQIMLGITKASLATDSFLSAASFQETTKVLTEAAIKGKVDHLVGLKENVIIGKHIPAGTGMKKYRDVALNTDARAEAMLAEELETEESAEGENAEVENAEAVSADAVNESLENEETALTDEVMDTEEADDEDFVTEE